MQYSGQWIWSFPLKENIEVISIGKKIKEIDQ